MNIAISNFAYENCKKDYTILEEYDIRYVESILSRIKPYNDLTIDDIKQYKNDLTNHKIQTKSAQAIFYGVPIVDMSENKIVLTHLENLFNFCNVLNIELVVFGSPSIRKKFDNFDKKISELFTEIDALATEKGIKFVIEPNSKIYGGEFFFDIEEIVSFIRKNNFNSIKTMIDTHNSILENKNPISEYNKFKDYVEHIHVSEKGLLPIVLKDFHVEFSRILKSTSYNKMITYEVIKTQDTFKSIETFKEIYE